LPAIAFLSCRDRVGDEFDETIAGMARFLLHAQRETGGFHPAIERTTGARVEGADPLFATGQAVFALTLVERMLLDEPELSARLDLPPVGVVHDAVERAMNFYAGPYWDFVLHDYFFLEENWHCLAARASLGHHRNDAYERFCLDYVGFKHRLMLIADREREADLVGGFGFSHLLPPHNTATAGYGEALAAKIEIARARGLDTGDDEAEMHDVIGFLIRQQLDEVECFACNSKISAVGAIGESMAVAEIRIDYVQHAWAAMGHGGRVLGLRHSR
jgi:hypothetical protein